MNGPKQEPCLCILRRGIADLLTQIACLAVPIIIQQTPHIEHAGDGWRRTGCHGSNTRIAATVEIDAQPATLYNQDFLGVGNVSRHGIVHVRFNELALGMVHIGKLLREIVRCEEMHAVAGIIVANNDGEEIFLVFYLFDHDDGSDIVTFIIVRMPYSSKYTSMNHHSVSLQIRMTHFPHQTKYP